jgi:hypothetical protein
LTPGVDEPALVAAQETGSLSRPGGPPPPPSDQRRRRRCPRPGTP